MARGNSAVPHQHTEKTDKEGNRYWEYQTPFSGHHTVMNVDLSDVVDMLPEEGKRAFAKGGVTKLIRRLRPHLPPQWVLATANKTGCRPLYVSDTGRTTSKKKVPAPTGPDWKVLVRCVGPNCPVLLLIGGFFDWQRQPGEGTLFKPALRNEVHIWSETEESLKHMSNSKVLNLELCATCLHSLESGAKEPAPYGELRGEDRSAFQQSLNPSVKGNTRHHQLMAERTHEEFKSGNSSLMGKNDTVARKAGSEKNMKARPGGSDELAGAHLFSPAFLCSLLAVRLLMYCLMMAISPSGKNSVLQLKSKALPQNLVRTSCSCDVDTKLYIGRP